jgi:muramidase (phage lysozyme)
MPTVVDSLIVTLGLDSDNFTKGQKQAAEALLKTKNQASRTAKEMQSDGAKAAEFFSSIKVEALSLIGVLVGANGIKAFIGDTTKSLADMGRSATNIGVAVPVLAAFRDAVQLNGGSADAATASFQNLTDQMEHLKTYGNSPLLPFLTTIGADRGDDAMATYMKFVKYAQDHAGDVPLINLVGHGLGLDQGSINEARRGLAQVRADFAKAFALDAPDQGMTDRATELQRALIALGLAAKYDGEMMEDAASGGLTHFLNAMTAMVDKNPAALLGLAGVAGYLTVIAGLNFKSLLTLFARAAPLLGLLGLTGQGGGTNDAEQIAAAKKQHEKYLAEHPDYRDPWTEAHGWWQQNMPTWLGGGGQPGLADSTMTPEQQSFLKSLSAPESGGDYTVKNGGGHFSDFSHFPEGVGPGGTSTAAGRYQFTSGTWQDVSTALGLKDFSPASQDRGAWYLAQREYSTKTGRDLQADLAAGGRGPEIAQALHGRWPSIVSATGARAANLGTRPNIPPAPPPLAAPASAGADNSTQITVNGLVVHTQAADAKGIARDISRALIAQSNSGPQ